MSFLRHFDVFVAPYLIFVTKYAVVAHFLGD